jgi:hypothetical protein
MKIRNFFSAIAASAIFSSSSNAATFQATNLQNGPGDRLYADSSSVPLASGISVLGVFLPGFTVSTSVNFSVLIENFQPVASAAVGGHNVNLGGIYPGYAYGEIIDLTTGFGLLSPGYPLYTFVGNGLTLGSSSAFALYQSDFLKSTPDFSDYTSATYVGAPVFGTFGVSQPIYYDLVEQFGGPSYPIVFATLNLVPEPSSAILASSGCVYLLRRRRK